MKILPVISSVHPTCVLGLLLSVALIILGPLPAAAGTFMDAVRVFTTEPACFEYLFTGVVSETDGQPLLAFNQRNGRTSFAKVGETLGPFRVAALESKTNRVYNPSLNAYLNQPADRVTLTGPTGTPLVLEQDQRLPRPGCVAWLVRLDNGLWWNVQELDVFFIDAGPVFVEEIDEDGVTVTAGQEVIFIRRTSSGEKNDLNRLWAEQKRQEQKNQELALQRRQEQEAAKPKPAATADSGASYFTYERGPHVEIRGPAQFFYGCEYRFPTAFRAYPCTQYVNGQPVWSYVVLPTRFETRYSGTLLIGP
ncbi:MAG: hypothetical protein KKE37_12395 [Verrucomicrobia bacterium]|nr:hypothetical protein [Verrucomicrobiota bacterium]MBU4430137.1 hypothetical protein [Verrucomicrobiota bacterium]MCG2681044.1 hypothetical protein [Kiritimatiellia bacterium]